ncbi:serine carboxypeptidase-like 26 [Salvia splendens]|uniref:serine carboxypeptidase-like 26 n=1 Tax=Salvia splendens TaxID=180675 RepID=UPI001C25745B|nr:serine carboxypeptidase-like 26 [Salvia splendens]
MILLFIILAFVAALNAENLQKHEYENDRIVKLPGQPNSPHISQFSGYITVNEAHGRALFYWFFEAQSLPDKRPLLLWFNGGPGCSSIGYGAAVELGPLRVAKKGSILEFNENSWNKEANVIFVESPIGVGFSYTNTSSDFSNIDDKFVAKDAYTFLVKWLERFPHFKDRDFFISGESYAGHYVPQLAELVFDNNKDTHNYPYINLNGFIVGNPETNDYYDYKGLLEYAWSHAVISDEEYDKAKIACDFKLEHWSSACNAAMGLVFDHYNEIDIYNIYAPSCLLNTTSSFDNIVSRPTDSSLTTKLHNANGRMRLGPGGYDPCFSRNDEVYFNRRDVRDALHVSSGGLADGVKWKECNDSLFRAYNYSVFSVLPIYKKLIQGGLKIWIYSGDVDGRVPVIGSRYCIEALNLSVKTPWTTWFDDHQVAGRIAEYEGGFSFVTVRGAGHLVPLNKPKQALSLIQSYFYGHPLPTHR